MYLHTAEREISENPHKLTIRNFFKMPVVEAELFVDIVSSDGEHIDPIFPIFNTKNT